VIVLIGRGISCVEEKFASLSYAFVPSWNDYYLIKIKSAEEFKSRYDTFVKECGVSQ